MAEIKKFLGVLYALGAGKNTRMSIKDMLSEDEFSWATHVPWLKKHGVTEKWLTHMFMNLHLQPDDWPDSPEAKRPSKSAPQTESQSDAGGGGGDDGESSATQPPNHRVSKCGRLLEHFNQRCMAAKNLERDASIDEQTALCNSRKCRLKHIQRHKKYNGIRIYSINESKSGYTWSFIVDTKDGTSAPEFAMRLCEQLPGVWHRVYMDNAFPQVRNLEKMYDMKVYGAGTMRPHFGFPPELHELVRKLNDKNSPLDVGEYEWMMAPLGDDRDASFLAVVWRDVGYVKFISTFHLPKEVLIYRRQPGKSEKDERSCIEGIKDYNQNMGGTDLLDALRYHNSTQRKTVKWWHALFFWILDNAVLNAYTLYECDFRDAGIDGKKLTRRQFIIKVAGALLGHMQSKPSKKRRKSDKNARGQPVICGGVMPIIQDKKLNCIHCYHTLNKQLQVKLCCKGCNSPLHVRCFEKWHEDHCVMLQPGRR